MLSKNISFKGFKLKLNNSKIKKDLKLLLLENLATLNSLKISYKYSYKKKLIANLKGLSKIRIIGMGG